LFTNKSIFNQFWHKTLRKLSRNLVKRIHSLQKHKKTQNLSNIYIYIYTLRVNKYLISSPLIIWNNSTQKSIVFGGYSRHQRSFSLSTLESDDFLSLLPQKNWKIRKIRFSTKIYFLKFKETNYLIAKNYRGTKMSFYNKFQICRLFYPSFTLILCFSIQSSLLKNICKIKSCKIKVEGAKSKLNFFSPIHNVMLGGEHQHKLISFNIFYNFYDFI